MKTNAFIKILLVLVVAFSCSIMFSNISEAATKTGFIKNNQAPRKYFTVDEEKLADITLTIVGNTKMKPENVKLYEVNEKGNNKKEIQFSSSITTNRKNHIYTLSHNKLLNGKEHYFYIEIKDEDGIVHKSGFRVFVQTKKVDNKEVKCYKIDDSPRITQWLASEEKLYFSIKDVEGIEYLKVQDLNNNNKETTFENLNSGNSVITIDTQKLKSKQEEFKIKIIAKEKNSDSGYAQQSEQTASFKLSHEKVKISPMALKMDRTVLMLDYKRYNYADLEAKVEPLIVTDNEKVTWESSDTSVATVSNTGKVVGKKEGVVTITAKTKNGLSTTCKVRVIGPMTYNRQGTGRPAKIACSGTWNISDVQYTKEEVESYANNIEKVFKTKEGQEKYDEAKQLTVSYNKSTDPERTTSSYTKLAGELGMNGNLIIISTRNQMFYGLKKNEKGEWKLDIAKNTSTGNATSIRYYLMYISRPSHKDGPGNYWESPVFKENDIVTGRNFGNVFHIGWIGTGKQATPSSAGCVHLSKAEDNKTYQWMTEAGALTRVIYIGPTEKEETNIWG